jgi:membrane protein involved in colicin uptake
MSDELTALQNTATQARAKADELNAALTEASSDEEKAEAAQADTDATAAESVFVDAKAKADADAAAQAEAEAKAKADADAAAAAAEADAKAKAEAEAAAAAQGGAGAEQVPDAGESRTGFVRNARPGDACQCPDGRKGTVHRFDEGLVCIPNADQGN